MAVGLVLVWAVGMSAPASAEVPHDREAKVGTCHSIEYFHIATAKFREPDRTSTRIGPFGVVFNTNQEIAYRAGGDFSGYSQSLVTKDMKLSFDTKKLPIEAGRRTITADDQTLGVTVAHGEDYSRVEIELDAKYNRSPRWIPRGWGGPRNPGDYPHYASENPFCSITLKEAMKALLPNGRDCLPDYYLLHYGDYSTMCMNFNFEKATRGDVVPNYAKYVPGGRDMKWHVKKREPGDPPGETRAHFGPFGMRILCTRELSLSVISIDMRNGWRRPMWLTMATKKKLDVEEGMHEVHADGQDIKLKVWHGDESSFIAAALPDTYQRTPHYWLEIHGGAQNPGDYPGYEAERLFCRRTVDEMLKALTGEASFEDFLPDWYQVSYLTDVSFDDIDPQTNIANLNANPLIWVMPYWAYLGREAPAAP
jgi:hypothetical protein